MIILGIDPSLRSTGFGLIESRGNQLTALCHGSGQKSADRVAITLPRAHRR